ncbi:proline--tRNA ligase [Candidatus Calescamantes bacterium]|nr:proline--tRNA ligase [Candidatus Calescamantes bacterium]
MLRSELLLSTLKETPESAEIASHILSLRAGLIQQLTSGVYMYLPLGVWVRNKITSIIREEMNAEGAQEVVLPILQPRALWESSKRWKEFGPEMMRLKDRKGQEYALGPTHEEVVTHLVKGVVKSYRNLPLILYQIQPKFRDEMRPRFGLIRAREFLMKDAYSFDRDWEGLEESYQRMFECYKKIFSRCGLDFVIVEADPGLMGGKISHEFMVPTENGEDVIVTCSHCGYAANREMAESGKGKIEENEEKPLKMVDTPNATTIEEVGKLLSVSPKKMIKTLLLTTEKGTVAALIRGDHELNITKLKKILQVEKLEMADSSTIQNVTGAPVGFSGPVGLRGIKIVADYKVMEGKNFVTGANQRDKHFVNVNPERDFHPDLVGDLRYPVPGDTCPRCKKLLQFHRSIEVGHIFQLGTKYSESMKAYFQNEDGKLTPFVMGCYGIGIDRIIVSLIEQRHDDHGIIWPWEVSPFQIIVLPLDFSEEKIKEVTLTIYKNLTSSGYEVLIDDRNERAGYKFKDADLIGIPLQIIIGKNFLQEGLLEIKIRETGERIKVKPEKLHEYLNQYNRRKER